MSKMVIKAKGNIGKKKKKLLRLWLHEGCWTLEYGRLVFEILKHSLLEKDRQ